MDRYIPAAVRRDLRTEVNHGCAVCGSPLVDYHHIIPKNERDHNNPEHMITLCPNHHRLADDGAISRERLYYLKNNPHNDEIVDSLFYFESEQPKFEIADLTCEVPQEGEYALVKINKKDLFVLEYNSGLITFNLEIYNQDNELIAEVTNNEWKAYTDRVWDLVYRSNELKIWDPDENIRLKLVYDKESDVIQFEGKFYYDNEELIIYPSRITSSRGGTVKGSGKIVLASPKNCVLFHIATDKGGIQMGKPFNL
ncbi:HNH endonuclease signature motif containing protein [Halorubrum aethiopicum]|uniref:HNH endonuclease signature motif containing protein n=1 Tax=Halorubrum aethiopicum TaxID=1758255 RepID=UPI000AB1F72E|nr:HNH endonuclease [Halorubrum aethiopicum]